MGAKPLVPRLRFPEFRDAPAWSLKPLEEVSDRVQEKVGNAHLVPVSISAGQGFVAQADKFGRDISGAQYRNYTRIQRGDFSYNKGNSKRYPQGCVYELKEFEVAAAPYAFVSFRLRSGNVNGFFQPQFERNFHGPQLARFITSGARSDGLLNVSPDDFFRVRLPVPPTEAEQRKIAECLTSLDEVIAAEGRKLAALRAHKKGLMQNLFPQEGETTPRLRFPEFRTAGEWKEKAMSTISVVVRGGSPRPIDQFLTSDPAGLNWLKIGDVDREAKYIVRTTERVRPEALSKTRVIRPGDFILSNSMSFGRPYISQIETCIHDGWIAVTNTSTEVDREFLYYSLLSDGSQRYFTTQAAGSGVQNLNIDIVNGLRVSLPTPAEQHRIASCLGSLDTLITKQANKLAALKTHKQGLMQGLFPSMEAAK